MNGRRAIPEKSPPSQNSPITRFIHYEHLVAGISGGVTSTLILHPLDLIKIRFQGKMYCLPRGDVNFSTGSFAMNESFLKRSVRKRFGSVNES